MPSFSLPAGRVRLRSFLPADLPAFAAYRAEPAVARYQSWEPYDLAQATAFVAGQVDADIPGPPGAWRQIAIAAADTDALLGDCALHLLDYEPRIAELGITLSPGAQGQGYGAEALRALLGYCFGPLGLHRVVALTDARNQGCVRLLERVGMRREAHFRQASWFKGDWCDEYQYARLAAEWGG